VEFRHHQLPDTYIPIFGPMLVALIICTCKEGKDSVSVSTVLAKNMMHASSRGAPLSILE
jgi:hypothetical protein